jgi:hypothetical protein
MNDFMERTLCEIAIASDYSQRADEEIRTAYDAVNKVSLNGVGYCKVQAIIKSLTLLDIVGDKDERAEQLASRVVRLKDRHERLAYLRKTFYEAYFNHPSFRCTSSKEREPLVQNQPLQEPYSQTQ